MESKSSTYALLQGFVDGFAPDSFMILMPSGTEVARRRRQLRRKRRQIRIAGIKDDTNNLRKDFELATAKMNDVLHLSKG